MPITPPARPSELRAWPEALATVLSCTYTARAGLAVAFGIPAGKHFRITYNYWAADALHTAEFYSEKPLPQGTLFPVRYNPDQPHHSQHTQGATPTRAPLLAIGIAGSIVISLAWLFVLRGCQ